MNLPARHHDVPGPVAGRATWCAYASAVEYAERLTVPLRWWVQGTMLVASLWLAVIVATIDVPVVAWVTTAVAATVMVACFLIWGSARVGVVDGQVVAGRARIPLQHVGEVVPLDADGVRRQAGVDADARALLVLRPYIKRGVRIEITDPADPTPYWLASCRSPERVVAAVRGARSGGTTA